MARCFSDGRAADRIEHSLQTLVAQRVHGNATQNSGLIGGKGTYTDEFKVEQGDIHKLARIRTEAKWYDAIKGGCWHHLTGWIAV